MAAIGEDAVDQKSGFDRCKLPILLLLWDRVPRDPFSFLGPFSFQRAGGAAARGPDPAER